MTSNTRPAGHFRTATASLVAGYATLLASFVVRHPVALTVFIPLGGLLIAVGIVLWLLAVVSEARGKGMV